MTDDEFEEAMEELLVKFELMFIDIPPIELKRT